MKLQSKVISLWIVVALFLVINVQSVSSTDLNLYNLQSIVSMPFPDEPELVETQETMGVSIYNYLFIDEELMILYGSSVMGNDLPEMYQFDCDNENITEDTHFKIQGVLSQFLQGHHIVSGGEIRIERTTQIDGRPARYISIDTVRRSINFRDNVLAIYNKNRVHSWKIMSPSDLSVEVIEKIFYENIERISFSK